MKKAHSASTKLAKVKAAKNRLDRGESTAAMAEMVESNNMSTIEGEVKREPAEAPRASTPSPLEMGASPIPSTPPRLAQPGPPSPPAPPPPSLTQDTHSSFFSLLREVLLNNDNPTTLKHLSDAFIVWSSSPISPLNEW